MKKEEGFSLLELMVVVVIIGILTAFAIPSYIAATKRAKFDEAITNLRLIHSGERMYRLDYNTYTDDLDDLYPGYIDDPNANSGRSFDYSIESATATTFSAEAEYIADTTKFLNIDEDGDISDSFW